MKNIYIFLFFVLFSTFLKPIKTFAQIDTRFWFAAPDISQRPSGTALDRPIFMRFAAFDQPATVVISMPATPAFTPIVVNIPAFGAASTNLTAFINLIETPRMTTITGVAATDEVDTNRNYSAIFPSGLLVESTAKISAYYEVSATNNPDIFALKGKNALGTDFYVPMQTEWKSASYSPNGHSGFVIVATEDNTTVTVTTTKATRSFGTGASGTTSPAGLKPSILLNRGQTYTVAAQQPIAGNAPAGSHVVSNKPIAITVYHDLINTGSGTCADLAGDQLVPVSILGIEYIVMRGTLGVGATAQPEKVYILATQAGTTFTVNRNGTLIAGTPTLAAGQQYVFDMDAGTHPRAYITSNKPIYVLHMSGYGCETGAAILPPIDCTGSRLVQFNRSSNESFSTTLMVKTGGEGNFLVNNVALPAALFTLVPGTGGVWKSARITYANNTTVVSGTTIPNGINKIENTTNLFHLGITNGGESSGCRYGYFSSFNSLNLGPDINIFYGSNVVLDASTFGANSYLWTPDGQTTPQITVNARKTENYTVTVNIGGCLLNAAICVGTIEYIWTGFKSTDYNDIDNWSRPCGVNVVPDCTRDVIIPDSVNGAKTPRYPNLNNVTVACRNLIIEKGAELNFTGTGQINVCGDMVHSGALNMPQVTNKLVFIGTKPQLYTRTATGTGEFATLRINNQTATDPRVKVSAGGSENMIVSSFGKLEFYRGFLITEGTKEVVVKNKDVNSITGHATTGSNAGNGMFVAGKLRRYVNTLGSYDLPVGLATETVSAPVAQAGKRATMVGTVSNAANWPTNTLNCTLNPFINNHAIALNDNNAQGDASSTTATNRQHITIPISAGISGNNLRTIEGWFKTDNALNSGGAIFYMGTPAFKQLFALRKGAATDAYRIDVGGGFGLDFTVTGINNGSWHHFAMTYDGANVEVYTDGLFRASLAVDLNTNVGNFYVGRYVDDTGKNWYLKGQYDNIRVWNTARTADEIQLNICSYYECVTPSGLIADYDMEDGYGFVDFKTRTCAVSLLQYERAKVEFQTPMTDADNLLAFFNVYPGATPTSPNEYRCQATFGTCQVLNHGFWTISAFNAATQVTGNGRYRLTLYNNAYGATSCASPKATIMKRSTSANPWTIPNFPALCYDNSLNATSMEWMAGFSDFAVPITLDPIILPVDLISLTAKPLTNTILVEWKTINEIDNAGFEVMRSTDGTTATKVGWVGQNDKGTYSFEDFEVNTNQTYYYYLNQVDNNGNKKTSPVVDAKIDASMAGGINVYPNPTEDNFTIDLGETYTPNTDYQIEVYNSIGMLLRNKTVSNTSKINMSLEGLAKGMYLVKVTTPTRTKFVKIEKE